MAEAQLGLDPSGDEDAATKAYVDEALKYPGITSTATAAGTTTLTVSDSQVQVFTGTTTQIVVLPTTSIDSGFQMMIVNNSTGAVTVQASNTSTVIVLAAGTNAILTSGADTPTSPSDWFCQYGGVSVVSGSALEVVGNAQVGGAQSTVVATAEATNSITYTDLATTTDQVTVTVGSSGLVMVGISGLVQASASIAFISFAMSGANSSTPTDTYSCSVAWWVSANRTLPANGSWLLTNLTPGSTTFKLKYRNWDSGYTVTHSNRRISVIPL